MVVCYRGKLQFLNPVKKNGAVSKSTAPYFFYQIQLQI
jgi:hypothetical protein